MIRRLGPGDGEELYVLTEPDNAAANALYAATGAAAEADVMWLWEL